MKNIRCYFDLPDSTSSHKLQMIEDALRVKTSQEGGLYYEEGM